MDGNGRWAKERGLNRTAGHEKGAKIVRDITTHCTKLGVKYLTLFAFSTENWARPKLEVEFLMKLLQKYLKNELEVYIKNNIKFDTIGDLSKFSSSLQSTINEVKTKTIHCKSMTQILALNYGSKDEITRTVKKLFDQKLEITEQNISLNLDTTNMPDVDMLIRTSGEIRVSNFMLWQIAYAEMFFTNTYWPEFNTSELNDMIIDFSSRHRKFGAL
jgi:undecaprenyl diphosphate synthase